MKNINCFLITFSFVMVSTAISQPLVVKVWPNGVPGSINCPNYVEKIVQSWGKDCFEKISNPELLVYPAPKDKSTGTAVLVCPGGGYQYVSIVNEGYEIARWLNGNGIAAIILKYRLPSDSIMQDKSIGPLQDAQEAMRIIRRNARKWDINPGKVGVMGFSAGGHLASTLCTHCNDKVYDASDNTNAKPDFSILVYPVITMDENISHSGTREKLLGKHPSSDLVVKFSNDLQVTKDTPPAFLVHSSNDESVPVVNSLNYYSALIKNHIPAELHIYQTGGHGYGLGEGKGTESSWPGACIVWLKAGGWL